MFQLSVFVLPLLLLSSWKKGEKVASVQDCERQAAFLPFSVLIKTLFYFLHTHPAGQERWNGKSLYKIIRSLTLLFFFSFLYGWRLFYIKKREFMLNTPELRSAGACKKHNKDLILSVCDDYYQTTPPTFHSWWKLFREVNELPEEVPCHLPGCGGLFLCTAAGFLIQASCGFGTWAGM